MFEALRRRLVRERRIYIMPTGRGVTFLALVVVQILTAATYNNNLIFLLAFFLFALFVVSMLQTHDNLRDVELTFVGAPGAFAGEPLSLAFQVSRPRARETRGLRLRLRTGLVRAVEEGRADLAATDPAATIRVGAIIDRRGVFKLPDCVLETFYPHGLFRAWIVFRPPGDLIVYPAPRGERVLHPLDLRGGESDVAGDAASPEGDFGELRAHREGDSYTQVAWKHFARTGQLYQKSHWGAARPHYVVPWLGDGEAELSQMCRWVADALKQGATFELPERNLGPAGGEDLAHACWRAFARVGS